MENFSDQLPKLILEKNKKCLDILDATIKEISKEKDNHYRLANYNRKFYIFFKIIIPILVIAAPTLVTYQTQVENDLLKLIAIILASIAGAASTFQSIFLWKENYSRSALTTLAFFELETKIKFYREDIVNTTNPIDQFNKLQSLNEKAQNELYNIKRKHLESEATLSFNTFDKEITNMNK